MTVRRTLVLMGVLVAAVLVTAATAALAHSALLSSEPVAGAQLDTSPGELVLVYTEEPDPGLSGVSVYDQTGAAVVENGELIPDEGDAETIRMALPTLEDGAYTVSWQALSAVDGHVTTGAFTFGVGEAAGEVAAPAGASADATGTSLKPLASTGRWMLYAGMALLLGWALSFLIVFRSAPTRRRWTLVACWALAALGLILLTVAEARSVDVPVDALLGSTTGARLVRIGVALAVCLGAVVLVVLRASALTAAVLAVAIAGAMYVYTLAGHAGAPGTYRWLQIGSQWVHIVAVGAWIGGLWWLVAGLWQRRGEPALPLVLRFSLLATVSLVAVVATGVVRALAGIYTWSALWSTDYGIAFLIKVGLVVLLVALAALNRFRHIPAMRSEETAVHVAAYSEPDLVTAPDDVGREPVTLGPTDRTDSIAGDAELEAARPAGPSLKERPPVRSLRRAVGGEIAFAVVIFGVTGVLAGLPPALDHEEMGMTEMDEDGTMAEGEMEEPTRLSVEGSDFGTSVRVTLDMEPGMVGENHFTVRVADYDTDEPLDANSVVLHFSVPARSDIGPSVVELEPTGDGTWETDSTVLAFPDTWRATVVIVASPDGYEIPIDFEVGTTAPVAPDTTDGGGMDDMGDTDGTSEMNEGDADGG